MFLVKKRATFKWKDAISGFPVSPGSAEALVRWGGKIKYVLIALLSGQHFRQNLLQSNCVCKDYSKSNVGRFWDTVYAHGTTVLPHKMEIVLWPQSCDVTSRYV